ncbi:MAG: carbohydrate ABC transporter permease [Anaerolineaceae bacterium]|nr:carbohydrate ABC transporter permease [Anaerolineaceae bacterium]
MSKYRILKYLGNALVYALLIGFAYIMLFPFLFMFSTSFKLQTDTYRYPPRLIPMKPVEAEVLGYDDLKPLYIVQFEGDEREFALVERSVPAGIYVNPADVNQSATVALELVQPSGGEAAQLTTVYQGETVKLWDVPLNGKMLQMVLTDQTALGRFVDPQQPQITAFQNLRLSVAVEEPTLVPENYTRVRDLQGLDRALTNTALVTILVVLGQLVTSVVGGYALARLKFPGREQIFLVYLGTIMIPFVVLITPLYQLMVMLGWVDKLASLIIPWVFSAYGTFMMRQFFITMPKEIEEAALIDGASRLQILWKIFLPSATPALATLATFSFLYAWNSFFWPLIVINTGNQDNHVLTLALSILRGKAADNANLVMAGAAIAILPPLIIYIFAQRFFVESATSSGVKG